MSETTPASKKKRTPPTTALEALTRLRDGHRPEPINVLHGGAQFAFFRNPKPGSAAIGSVFPEAFLPNYPIIHESAELFANNDPVAAFLEVIFRKSDGSFGFERCMLFFHHPVCNWSGTRRPRIILDEKAAEVAAETRAIENATLKVENAWEGIQTTEQYLGGTMAPEDIEDLLTDIWFEALDEGADQGWFRFENDADLTAAEERSIAVAIEVVEELKGTVKDGTSAQRQSALFIVAWEEALERGNDEGWFAASRAVADAQADIIRPLGVVQPWLYGLRPLDETLDSFMEIQAKLAAAQFCAQQLGYSHVYIAMNDVGSLPAVFGLTVEQYGDQTVMTMPVTEPLALVPELRHRHAVEKFPPREPVAGKPPTEPATEPPPAAASEPPTTPTDPPPET